MGWGPSHHPEGLCSGKREEGEGEEGIAGALPCTWHPLVSLVYC